MHLDIFHIECAPVALFRTKLHLPINDAVLIVGIAKFKTK